MGAAENTTIPKINLDNANLRYFSRTRVVGQDVKLDNAKSLWFSRKRVVWQDALQVFLSCSLTTPTALHRRPLRKLLLLLLFMLHVVVFLNRFRVILRLNLGYFEIDLVPC